MAINADTAGNTVSAADATSSAASDEPNGEDHVGAAAEAAPMHEDSEQVTEKTGPDADAPEMTESQPAGEVGDGETAAPAAASPSLRRPALVGTLMVLVLAGLAAYVGVQAYQAQRTAEQRNLLVQVARQGAVNLTTIDWEHADDDIQRILGSATGQFYDDFAQRSKPFVDVVKQAQSKSVGTVTEAGMESYSGDSAQVLVAVSVTTTNPADPEQSARNWRMRMSVEKVGDDAKVSNVEFVP